MNPLRKPIYDRSNYENVRRIIEEEVIKFENNSQQVIISENCLREQTRSKSLEFCIENVAKKSIYSDTQRNY